MYHPSNSQDAVLSIGKLGHGLTFTALIAPSAQEALEAKRARQSLDGPATFSLTPGWRMVPSILVQDVRDAGVQLPDHWLQSQRIYPVVEGIAFYIRPFLPTGMALSASMFGVNMRLGIPEEDLGGHLTDDPRQSYWSEQKPWIDGYVRSHSAGVSQFVPLRGKDEIAAFDVATLVGVKVDCPWRDGISFSYHLPVDVSRLASSGSLYRSDNYEFLESTMKGMSYGPPTRGVLESAAPEQVGMGAGAVMAQHHEDNPAVNASDFVDWELIRITSRLVWSQQYNVWAQAVGGELITPQMMREFRGLQADYDRQLWRWLGVQPTHLTAVDNLPTAKIK